MMSSQMLVEQEIHPTGRTTKQNIKSATTSSITSAAGILVLLNDKDPEIQMLALRKLNDVVDRFWAEISDNITTIEQLYENEKFPARHFAALVASKVYYHIGNYDDALIFALGAGDLFDVFAKGEFVETVVAKCIDRYIKERIQIDEGTVLKIDPRLENIVERMFKRCYEDGQFGHAIGIALEARRADKLEEAIRRSDKVSEMVNYALQLATTLIQSHRWRDQILQVLISIYRSLPEPDYTFIVQCLLYLKDPQPAADLLLSLIQSPSASHVLIATQICFDLEENSSRDFIRHLSDKITEKISAVPSTNDRLLASGDTCLHQIQLMHRILSGDERTRLHLEFLLRNHHSDPQIIKNTKEHAGERHGSVPHLAAVISYAFMQYGTTQDAFLRENTEWLTRASNWNKFSIVASIGMIHRGTPHAMALLSSYLPSADDAASSFSADKPMYSEGGAVYALGLIYPRSNREDMLSHLLSLSAANNKAPNEEFAHGLSLALGLVGLGSQDLRLFDALKQTLYCDMANSGEAAGIALGLTLCGTGHAEACTELLTYARDTQHEKVIRGVSIGLALVMYGHEEGADALIAQMTEDKDALIRYGGMFAIGMAYAGTANNKAVKLLLHYAVSDVSDDVRRAAVMSLGFLLFRRPYQIPSVVKLLSESYNPHVRYGAMLALGVACAGTGMQEAISLLEVGMNDSVDFVRQGAFLATAMVLMQYNHASCQHSTTFRKHCDKVIADKHEDLMAKVGAILAQGILDAGGRNVTISLQSRHHHANMMSLAGLLVFLQHWYWYPYLHFLSLSFAPTGVFLVNKQCQLVQQEVVCQARPSLFAYPPNIQFPAMPQAEKVLSNIFSKHRSKSHRSHRRRSKRDLLLSTASGIDEDKKKRREKESGEQQVSVEVSSNEKTQPSTEGASNHAVKTEATAPMETNDAAAAVKSEVEGDSFTVSNPARVLPWQVNKMKFDSDRYVSVTQREWSGIVVLQDMRGGQEPEPLLESLIPKMMKSPEHADEGDEPGPPEPFEWTEEMNALTEGDPHDNSMVE